MSETATSVEIAHLKGEIAELKKTCDDFRKDIRGVRDFQIWLTGGISVVAFFFGLFATEIKKALGL